MKLKSRLKINPRIKNTKHHAKSKQAVGTCRSLIKEWFVHLKKKKIRKFLLRGVKQIKKKLF
jgi:hypothetical protein